LVAYARVRDSALADWIAQEVRVPATMVDSITPATDDALMAVVAGELGMADHAPVQREEFAQWVIEDVGRSIGPDFASVGAILTPDVAGFERAKLRILNGAHSTIAYAGLLRGSTSVSEAMNDPELARFIAAMIKEDIVPMVGHVPGLDLSEYSAAVLDRFRNPLIVHRLEQIAQDGSQKLPYRLGDTLLANLRAGKSPRRVISAIASWIAFARARRTIVDPAAEVIRRFASAPDPRTTVAQLADAGLGLPRDLVTQPDQLDAIATAVGAIESGDWDSIFNPRQ
jgi:fructuronate reductase